MPLNVAAAVKSPKVAPDPDARNLTQAQVKAMIHAARSALLQEELRTRTRPRYLKTARLRLNLALWAYYSGCRVTEIAQAKWEDLHPRIDGDFSLSVLGKGRTRRTIPMPRSIIEEIAGGSARERCGRILPVGARRIQTVIKALAEQAGLDSGVSPHWLRHSHASHAVDRGAPLHVVQGSLGHASLATLGIYLHRGRRGAGEYLSTF